MPIEKGLIGYQDISFGTETFQRKSQSGQLITLDQIRASHVPILDSAGRFTGTNIEAALAETMTREESGSTVKKLTNRSGAQRVAGDVVIIDTSNDDSFTTTTTEGNVLVLGVVLETTENLATGRVATGGYVGSVKVTGATTRGQFLKTSTTVLKATPVSTLTSLCFAVAVSNGASTVAAIIFKPSGDAETIDGYSAGNSSGNVPVSNGTVNTNLNADILDGKHLWVVNLGDWDMDTTASITITVPGTPKTVYVDIIHDNTADHYPLNYAGTAGTAAGYWSYSSASGQVTITRVTGGFFDNTSFDATPYNRGTIAIVYNA